MNLVFHVSAQGEKNIELKLFLLFKKNANTYAIMESIIFLFFHIK